MPVSHFFISKWHCNRMPTILFKIVFAKSVCFYLGCFPLCCAESALCSRWTLDRQSKSRRDNSSRLASYLPALTLLPALVLHPSGRSLSNKRRKPPRFLAISPDVFCRGDSQAKKGNPRFLSWFIAKHIKYKGRKSNEACLFLTLLHRSKLQPSEQGEVYNKLQQLDTNQKRKTRTS